jgi:hypothetical protein
MLLAAMLLSPLQVCLNDWARKQQTHGRTTCPVCRKDIGLNRATHYGGPPDELGGWQLVAVLVV